MTVLQLVPAVRIEAKDLVAEARRDGFSEGLSQGLREGFLIGMGGRRARVPEHFLLALGERGEATMAGPEGAVLVIEHGAPVPGDDRIDAWLRLIEVQNALRDELREAGHRGHDVPVMRRVELPERIAAMVWAHEDGREVIVVSLATRRRALAAALRAAGPGTRTGLLGGAS